MPIIPLGALAEKFYSTLISVRGQKEAFGYIVGPYDLDLGSIRVCRRGQNVWSLSNGNWGNLRGGWPSTSITQGVRGWSSGACCVIDRCDEEGDPCGWGANHREGLLGLFPYQRRGMGTKLG